MNILSALFFFSALWSYQPEPLSRPTGYLPPEMKGIGIQENLGQKLDLSLNVRDELGQTRSLGSFFQAGRPVLFSFVYYACPGLCNFHLNGVTEALKQLKWSVGKEFDVIALSFDSKEGPDLAGKKKNTYLNLYERPGSESGWHFLTADEPTVQALTRAAGFSFRWNEAAQEWAHGSAAIVLTPQAQISRYVHGIAPEAQTLKWAMSEATQGRVGNLLDQISWLCMTYDPKLSKYTLYAFRLVQLGGGLMILFLGFLLIPQIFRSRRQRMST